MIEPAKIESVYKAVRRPPVAIVIPVYKHSTLLTEAIASVRTAAATGDAHIIIIDDGCPNFQTLFSGSLSAAEGIHYIRQINTGLSGARNTGINFVIAHLPDCESVFFLDADNRLSTFSVNRFQTLIHDNPNVDWFYPDITMIGIPWNGDYSGPFRCLCEMMQNICEAGSLVRRRVFEQGCRFDEKMRNGYEDWEFWLSLMERGFVGSHMPASGFLYRKRAESMLTESERRHREIMQYIETKHPWMRDILTSVELEHHEAPRFAVVCSDSFTVLLGSDPAAMQETDQQNYSRLLRLSLEHPNWASAGAILVFASKPALRQLERAGLLQALFWRADIELKENNFFSISVDEASDGFYSQSRSAQGPYSDLLFAKISVMRATLLDVNESWIEQILQSPEIMGFVNLDVKIPKFRQPNNLLRMQRGELYEFVRRERRRDLPRLWSGRLADKHEGTPDVTMLSARLQEKFRQGVLPCRLAERGRSSVAMILPIMEFGGVEKVALRVAREFKRRGFQVDLIIYGNKRAYKYETHDDVYGQVYVIDYIDQDYSGAVYQGTQLPSNLSRTYPEIGNLLQSYDVVVNNHAAGVLHNFMDIRRAGVITINYLHLVEYTKYGRSTGHPVIGLAFEHSIDLMACCSRQMATQIAALGVPREKILEVPNGPGAEISSTAANLAAELREDSANRTALRVLYFGRLDVQKGLDHLSEIVKTLQREPNLFHIRVVGGRVVDIGVEVPEPELDNEPPIYEDAEISELYQWADVIIMPSRFEGLPLTIIEAMMLGVVPIATDVGAISEVVTDGEDGYVICGDSIAQQMIDLIRSLQSNRETLRRMSRNAQSAAAARNWTRSATPLIDRVEDMLCQRARVKKHYFGFSIFNAFGNFVSVTSRSADLN